MLNSKLKSRVRHLFSMQSSTKKGRKKFIEIDFKPVLEDLDCKIFFVGQPRWPTNLGILNQRNRIGGVVDEHDISG